MDDWFNFAFWTHISGTFFHRLIRLSKCLTKADNILSFIHDAQLHCHHNLSSPGLTQWPDRNNITITAFRQTGISPGKRR